MAAKTEYKWTANNTAQESHCNPLYMSYHRYARKRLGPHAGMNSSIQLAGDYLFQALSRVTPVSLPGGATQEESIPQRQEKVGTMS